jgi:hypothetical protein
VTEVERHLSALDTINDLLRGAAEKTSRLERLSFLKSEQRLFDDARIAALRGTCSSTETHPSINLTLGFDYPNSHTK